jgi:hypothetical protein
MRRIVATALAALTVGCVSTRTTGIRSADYEGAKFRGVLVYVMTDDLTKRQHYEEVLVRELAGRNIKARSAMSLFPPVDSPTQERISAVMDQNGLDTVLRIAPVAEAHDTVVTGQVSNANCYGTSSGTANATVTGSTGYASYSGTSQANCYGNTHNTTKTQHALAIEIRLVEYSNNKTVWMAQSAGQGGAGGLMGKMGVGSDIIEHMASDVGSQLQDSKLF